MKGVLVRGLVPAEMEFWSCWRVLARDTGLELAEEEIVCGLLAATEVKGELGEKILFVSGPVWNAAC